MARKSRRNNNIIEKKQEMMTPEIITGPQLETGVYARLSVEKDNEETIQTQIEMLHQYVEEHGEYHLVDTYVDNGYTGTDFDRPGFIRMMEDVRTGKIQCIIVKDLSRFGRNFIETGYYIETIFPCLNVRLISINDEFDSSREEDRNSIVMPVKNMINEMYAKDASKKKVLAFEMQSKRGDATIARSIYGYIVDKKENQLKVNPETAPIVRAIFRWYQMGRGTGAIVKRLKMLDIMTPHAYKAMCDRKVLLEKMKEGSYDKGELVSLRVRIQNMQFKLMKAEETSATLYENFATGLLDEQEYQMLREHYTEEKEKLETGIREAQTRKRVVEKSIEEFLEIEKNLEKYLDERSFNQKMIDELVEKIYVSSKGMIEIQMKCSDVFQKITEILE